MGCIPEPFSLSPLPSSRSSSPGRSVATEPIPATKLYELQDVKRNSMTGGAEKEDDNQGHDASDVPSVNVLSPVIEPGVDQPVFQDTDSVTNDNWTKGSEPWTRQHLLNHS